MDANARATEAALSDDRTDADRALEGIPVDLRVVLVLRDLCDLDVERIGEVLDLPPETVRARLAAGREAVAARLAPDEPAAARAAEEAAARGRALVRDAVPPLDDLTRHRLVRTAVRAGPPGAASATRRHVKVFAVAAAVLLAVISVGAVLAVALHSDDGSSGDRSGGRAPALRGEVGDLGDVTSPAALRSLLDRRARHRGGRTGGASSGTTDPGANDCVDELAGGKPARFSGTATYRGEAAAVVGVARGGRTIVFVVARSSCTDVLASISR